MSLVGLSVGGFLIYQGIWTNHVSEQKATQISHALEDRWASEPAEPAQANAPLVRGDAFALLYLPKLRSHIWGLPVLEGTDDVQLDSGIGHFIESAQPGQVGNFALAGHRTTHGEPLANVDQLRKGDAVYVRTQTSWYTYVLDRDAMLQPSDTWVIKANPDHLVEKLGSDRLITLVTCDPRWGSQRRWVWWGHLIRETSVDSPPVAVEEILRSDT